MNKKNQQFETPILFLTFNRPDTTERVFSAIREIQPKQLFIAGDGPRANHPEDQEKVLRTREIVANIDWPCEVKTLNREKNLGCKIAVSSAIDWFFGNVEEGIILEDDCLPDPSFFPFCEELLERYRTDERIMLISGFNTAGSSDISESYLFTKYVAIWGWASWRRAWKHYDVSISSWKMPKARKTLYEAIGDEQVWKSKRWTYDQIQNGNKNTWDYQWEYAVLMNHGLTVVPSVNLIENIGFGTQATHTASSIDKPVLPDRKKMSFPLTHPVTVATNKSYDELFSSHFRDQRSLFYRIRAKIETWLN